MADTPEAPAQAWSVMPPAQPPANMGAMSESLQPLAPAPPPEQGLPPAQADPEPHPGLRLPATFPKKRRGRPPGRPNMTVREADYEENALVQAWNAAKSERALTVVPVRIRDALNESALVHESQRAIFRMPSRELIYYVQGWITARHVASQRPSYVNGLLIHSRGQDAPVSCVQCVERRSKNAVGPFLTCRTLQGIFHNSCSNCKWFDNTSTCSLYTGPKPNRKRKAKEITIAPEQPNGTETTPNPVQAPALTPGAAPNEVDTAQIPPDHGTFMGGVDGLASQPGAEAPHADGGEQPTTSVSSEPMEATPDADGDEHDANSVDAQLAAQLLPEINRDE